jgi:hypothetical protein
MEEFRIEDIDVSGGRKLTIEYRFMNLITLKFDMKV